MKPALAEATTAAPHSGPASTVPELFDLGVQVGDSRSLGTYGKSADCSSDGCTPDMTALDISALFDLGTRADDATPLQGGGASANCTVDCNVPAALDVSALFDLGTQIDDVAELPNGGRSADCTNDGCTSSCVGC